MFKIVVEAVQHGCCGNSVFWDSEAAKSLKTSAAQLRSTMIEAGINDPLEFPLALDVMLGLKFAFKVKWHPRFGTCSVVQFLKDKKLIAQLEGAVDGDGTYQEGEITSAQFPNPATPTTNVKRMSPDASTESSKIPMVGGDLSSTKLKKVVKRGKKTAV
ncbi:hypothetical protein RYX36_025931 [Vicia faba]